MSKKNIIITEAQEEALIHLLNKDTTKQGKPYTVNPEKVLIVKQFLDKNFKRGNIENIGDNGMPCKVNIVGLLSSNGEVLRNILISIVIIGIQPLSTFIVNKYIVP